MQMIEQKFRKCEFKEEIFHFLSRKTQAATH